MCSRCLIQKPLSDFYSSKLASDGKLSSCKACEIVRARKTEIKICVNCQKTFNPWKGYVAQIYCSLSCKKSAENKRSVGEKNPNWKGGATSEADKFYSSSAWKEVRTAAFKRDDWTCQDCLKRGGRLEANHIKPRSKFPDLKLELTNIETLCKKCHDGKKWMVYIK